MFIVFTLQDIRLDYHFFLDDYSVMITKLNEVLVDVEKKAKDNGRKKCGLITEKKNKKQTKLKSMPVIQHEKKKTTNSCSKSMVIISIAKSTTSMTILCGFHI